MKHPTIMILSSEEDKNIALEVQSLLHLSAIGKTWFHNVYNPGDITISAITDKIRTSDFIICIWGGNDVSYVRKTKHFVPRDNLILEAGISIATLGLERTFLLVDKSKNTKIPSNLNGISIINYDLTDMEINIALSTPCHIIRKRIEALGQFKNETEEIKAENLRLKSQLTKANNLIKGNRLFYYKDYYPIKLNKYHIPSIDAAKYKKAMNFFLEKANYDELAVKDLIYLRESTISIDGDFLNKEDLKIYNALVERYKICLKSFQEENENLLKPYIRLVNDIGDTFKNVYVEFILHNVRNPIHSIVAAKNTEQISKRKLGDPSTRFVYQYVTNQGALLMEAMEDGSKICYFKRLGTEKYVKATTTPIFDPKYGLIAILCINIDIDAIKNLNESNQAKFFSGYIENTGHTPPFEIY